MPRWDEGIPGGRRNRKGNMKKTLTGLSQRYVAALRRNLKQGFRASLRPAERLGRQAAGLGLESPELARIHERALAAPEIPDGKRSLIQRARMFFTEAVIPVVQTHRALMLNQGELALVVVGCGQKDGRRAVERRILTHALTKLATPRGSVGTTNAASKPRQ